MLMQFENTPYWSTLRPIIDSGAMQAAIDGVYKYPYRINLYTGISCMFSCHFCNRNYDYAVKDSDNVFSRLIEQDDGSDKHRFGVTGGLEPLTSPYIGKICKDLHDGGYVSRMVTNGFLLNDKMLGKNPYINSLDNIRVSLYGLDYDETIVTTKHAKAYEVVKKNLTNYNKRDDRTLLYLNYVLLPENLDRLESIMSYILDIGGADSISLREDHSFRFNVEDRNKLQDALLRFDERVKKYYQIKIDYGYGLQNAMKGIDTPLVKVSHKELIDTQSPQVKVCVDPRGDIFSYMDAGFTGRHGVERYCLGNVTNSSLQEQLKKMKKIVPLEQDPTYLDAFNHLIHRYIHHNSK
jgi:TDP-4-amino-4,6-dideoxy-D-glucose deaminase